MIAAFDYKRFKQRHPLARLLFVAHRKEILEQSMRTFQEILNDFNFGELYVDGNKPTDIEHLFIRIQFFNAAKLSEWTTKDFYDYICKWVHGKYDTSELEKIYTADRKRCAFVPESVNRYVTDMDEVKELGFCVSVNHREY